MGGTKERSGNKSELKTEFVYLSDNNFGNINKQSLPSMATHPSIRGNPGLCIPHELNIRNDIINSNFELLTFL